MLDHLTAPERIVYESIEYAANSGMPCPSNQWLANRLGLRSVSGPCRYLDALQKKGLITVQQFGPSSRVVTILSTGKKTEPTSFGVPTNNQTLPVRKRPLKAQQTHYTLTDDASERGRIADAVLTQGRNLHNSPWRAS